MLYFTIFCFKWLSLKYSYAEMNRTVNKNKCLEATRIIKKEMALGRINI